MKHKIDYILLGVVGFMVAFSLLFFACLSASISMQRFNTPNHYFFRQLFLGFLPAIIAGFIVYKIPLNFLKKWAPWMVLVNLLALFLVFLPFLGTNAGGATRWFNLGFASIQPAEFLKITSILYLSAWIASKLSENKNSDWKNKIKTTSHNFIYIFLPFAFFLAVITIALKFQSDVSTLGIIALTLLAVYFSAKTPLWHTLLVVLMGLGSLCFFVIFEPYRLQRFMTLFNPDSDPLGKGMQIKQSLIALGSGGFFGKGLGMSIQKFSTLLPQATCDSIFPIIGEEFGIIGGVLLISAFIFIFWRGIKIASATNDRFSKMLAVGIVTWITLQALINISSGAGIFPLAGIPLPFFSMGGSHLVVEMIGIGLLLNISKNT